LKRRAFNILNHNKKDHAVDNNRENPISKCKCWCSSFSSKQWVISWFTFECMLCICMHTIFCWRNEAKKFFREFFRKL